MINKVTCSLATLKEREESLKLTVQSLLPQVDRLNIYLHGYDEIPEWLKHKKITIGQGADNKDNDKFFWVPETKGFHLLCDDDIIYPKDYVKAVKEDLKRFGYEIAISYMGANPLRLPIASYYQDRLKISLFDELDEDLEMKILGTGCLAYYTKEPLQFYYNDAPWFMSDIIFSTFLADIGVQKVVPKHKANWFKYTNITTPTIYDEQVNDDFEQTKWINSRADIFQTEKHPFDFPKVSIIVVVSRLKTHRNAVKQCLDSLRAVLYPNYEIIMVDNNERLITIGKAYNDGVQQAKGKYVLFVGDDDYITSDYLFSMVNVLEHMPGTVTSTSYLTMFDEEGNIAPKELVPTGMWLREYLLENPFAEYLTKWVDSDAFEKLRENNKGSIVVRHQYGYWYRVHPNQVSGMKVLGNPHENPTNANISPILEKIRNRFKETL